MADPFETQDADYLVLRNAENQHSLWPGFAEVPDGWAVVHGPTRREACIAYVREKWVDLRPRSVAEFLAEQASYR